MKLRLTKLANRTPLPIVSGLLITAALLKLRLGAERELGFNGILPAGDWRPLGVLLVIGELLIGVCLLAPKTRSLGVLSAFALSALYVAVHGWHLATGVPQACSCYGKASQLWPWLAPASAALMLALTGPRASALIRDGLSQMNKGSRRLSSGLALAIAFLSFVALASKADANPFVVCIQGPDCDTSYFCQLKTSNGNDECADISWTSGQYVTRTANKKTFCTPGDPNCVNNQPG